MNMKIKQATDPKAVKPYKVATYSDGSKVDTRGQRGRLAKVLKNGAKLVSITEFSPPVKTQEQIPTVYLHTDNKVPYVVLVYERDGKRTEVNAERGKPALNHKEFGKLVERRVYKTDAKPKAAPQPKVKPPVREKPEVKVEVRKENVEKGYTTLVYSDGTTARQGVGKPRLFKDNGAVLLRKIIVIPDEIKTETNDEFNPVDEQEQKDVLRRKQRAIDRIKENYRPATIEELKTLPKDSIVFEPFRLFGNEPEDQQLFLGKEVYLQGVENEQPILRTGQHTRYTYPARTQLWIGVK